MYRVGPRRLAGQKAASQQPGNEHWQCPQMGRRLRGRDGGAGREPKEASCLSGFYQGFWVAPAQTAQKMYVFSPPVSDSGPLWSTSRRESERGGPGCRERSSQHGAGRDGALTVVSSPVATWTGTSSRWFRDSCPPTSTCSLCEYPGGLRPPDLPQRTGGPSASDPVAPALLEFPTDPTCG